jgi:hypothetical protein
MSIDQVVNIEEFIKESNTTLIKLYGGTDLVDPITKITDNLFLGQGRLTAHADILIKLGITHVVSIGRTPHKEVINGPFYKFELQGAQDVDHENLMIHFPTIFSFMRKALNDGGKIYVHCEMGCSRGATVMIAFLRANGYFDSLQSAYNHVKKLRPWISPNLGFQEQLQTFFSEKLVCSISS